MKSTIIVHMSDGPGASAEVNQPVPVTPAVTNEQPSASTERTESAAAVPAPAQADTAVTIPTEEIVVDAPGDTPAATELPRNAERAVRQRAEAGMVGNAILQRRMDELKGKDLSSVSVGDRRLSDMRALGKITAEEFRQQFPNGLDATRGNSLKVNIDGEEYIVVLIQDVDENNSQNFQCKVRRTDGSGAVVKPVHRKTLQQAQFISEKDAITASLPPDKRAAVQLYIDSLEGKDDSFSQANVEANDKAIEAGAKAAGMLTADDIRECVNNRLPETKPDGSALSTAEKAQRERVLKIVEGKKVLDANDAVEVLDVLGTDPESLQLNKNTLKASIEQLTLQVLNNPNASAEQRQQAKDTIAKMEAELKFYDFAADAFGQGGRLEEVFKKMQEGTLDPANSRTIIDAIRGGNDSEIILSLFPDLKVDPEDNSPEAQQKRLQAEALMNAAKKGGLGLLVLLGLLIAGGFVMTEKAISGK